MKTTTKISAFGVALIFCATTTLIAGSPNGNTKKTDNPGIRYQVNVHLNTDKHLCKTYIVEMVDQNNRVIAPVQSYLPETEGYNFFEAGPVTGIRIARLTTLDNTTITFCDQVVSASPDVKFGNFRNGQTYTFKLYVTTDPPKKD